MMKDTKLSISTSTSPTRMAIPSSLSNGRVGDQNGTLGFGKRIWIQKQYRPTLMRSTNNNNKRKMRSSSPGGVQEGQRARVRSPTGSTNILANLRWTHT